MRNGFGQHFDRDVAPELGVMCLINLAHSSCANLRKQFVAAETCHGAKGHYFFPVGTFCFNSSNQFNTTLICVGAVSADSLGLSIKKRLPSGDTS